MVSKKYRLTLARLLKLYKEVDTDKGTLIAEAESLEVGTEVFIDGEEGLVPAPDGVYVDESNKISYKVEGGTIVSIEDINDEVIEENTNTETEDGTKTVNDNMATETEPENKGGNETVEDNTEPENKPEKDEKMARLEEENEALKAKVAELEATVSDLEDQIADYKKKEEEVSLSVDEKEKNTSNKFDRTNAMAEALKAVKKLEALK
jgi:predicted RNase H-like nuclease (RuvC/YqgF family)